MEITLAFLIVGYMAALMAVVGFVTSLVNGDGALTAFAVAIWFGVFTALIGLIGGSLAVFLYYLFP